MHREQLKDHLMKITQCKAELKLAQDNWIARNKIFNEWMQKTLGVEETKSELHLTEILTKWDKINDDLAQSNLALS